MLSYDPEIICTLDQSLDSLFMFNTITRQTDPLSIQSVVFYDEIGLMKGSANTLVNFRVTSFAAPVSAGNIDLSSSFKEIL